MPKNLNGKANYDFIGKINIMILELDNVLEYFRMDMNMKA